MLIDGRLLIDFPPDSYMHAVRGGVDLSAVRTLLVTHSHTDHFYAEEFVNRGYKFAEGMASPTLDLYGNAEVLAVYREGTRREMREEVASAIRLHALEPYARFSADGYDIAALPANHTPKEQALLYAVRGDKTVFYMNDTGLPEERLLPFPGGTRLCRGRRQPRLHLCRRARPPFGPPYGICGKRDRTRKKWLDFA